jgi:hypothetical protein
VVAHGSGNSLAALRSARLLGVTAVEADIHLFRGRLEVRHDDLLIDLIHGRAWGRVRLLERLDAGDDRDIAEHADEVEVGQRSQEPGLAFMPRLVLDVHVRELLEYRVRPVDGRVVVGPRRVQVPVLPGHDERVGPVGDVVLDHLGPRVVGADVAVHPELLVLLLNRLVDADHGLREVVVGPVDVVHARVRYRAQRDEVVARSGHQARAEQERRDSAENRYLSHGLSSLVDVGDLGFGHSVRLRPKDRAFASGY